LSIDVFNIRAMTVKEPMDRMNNEKMREKKERGDRGERERERRKNSY